MSAIATKHRTMKECLAAARKRYGKSATIRTNRTAKTPAEREVIRNRLKEINERLALVKNGVKELVESWKELLKMAEFAVDTDGDKTAIAALRHEVLKAWTLRDKRDEYDELIKERDSHRVYSWLTKYEVLRLEGMGGIRFSVQECHADTLDELYEKITAGK